jgi:hypothetical protein
MDNKPKSTAPPAPPAPVPVSTEPLKPQGGQQTWAVTLMKELEEKVSGKGGLVKSEAALRAWIEGK